MYFKTTTVAGKTKEIHKSYTKRIGAKYRGKKKEVTKEDMEKVNQANAERKLRLLINANFKEGDFHLVLTYKKELRPTAAGAKETVKAFLNDLRNLYRQQGKELKYINVTEYEGKAIHHHMIINDIENTSVSMMVRKLWKYGNPKFTPLDNSGQYKLLASYLIKETSKTYKEKDGGHMQRYSCSRNLVRPQAKIETINAQRWEDEPKPIKGYYIDKDSVYNGIDPFTGRMVQRYTMIKIDG